MISKKIFTTALLAAGLVLAQGPGRQGPGRPGGPGDGPPPDPQQAIQMHVDRLATMLSLTADQKTQATRIFTEAQTAGEAAHTTVQTDRPLLSAAIKANDLANIDRLSTAIGAATGQSMAIQSKAEAAFYAILTADQKAKYDERPMGGMRGPMGGGPGGPGGFGRSGRGAPRQ